MSYKIDYDRNLASLHTFGLNDSVAACYVEFDTPDLLPDIFADRTLPRPFLPMGGGSNMFFSGKFSGTILHSSDSSLVADNCTLHVGSAVTLDNICRFAAAHGLWGAEALSGIPGEISGAIVQNAGAYGSEIADIVQSVSLYDIDAGAFRTFGKEDCHFGYRTSVFKQFAPTNPRYIITGATLRLTAGKSHRPTPRGIALPDNYSPADVRQAVLALRNSKLPDPAQIGSAGSFFKNPVIPSSLFNSIKTNAGADVPVYPVDDCHVKIPAAWLIDQCGLKGTRLGGAAVWHKQPLVLVNADGTATSADILALASLIITTVYNRFGVRLEPEVIHIK